MGMVCGQGQKTKSQELHASKQMSQSIKQDQENVEFDDLDQLFCPSLTKNYILNPKFLSTEESKYEKEELHLITQIEQNSSQLSLGIQSELNNLNEIQGKQKNQNKLKPDHQKRMSLEQRLKIILSPSLCRKKSQNTTKSSLGKMFQGNNKSTKQKEQLILTKGKKKLQSQDKKLE